MTITLEKKIETAKDFADYANVTAQEAEMLLGYAQGHGYAVFLDENNAIYLVDVEEPENGIVASDMDELLERVSTWNYEFIQDSEVVGEQREQVLKDMEMIDDLLGCSREGIPIGYPTVKELIAILSKLPQDYKVTCCGAENYLYLCANDKYITIDCEHYWG